MPFLGQDWRSPGWSWTKTEGGWQRGLDHYDHTMKNNNPELQCATIAKAVLLTFCGDNKKNLFVEDVCELAATKKQKDFYNITTKSHFVYRDEWIYVQKGSTKERHGYCTLGEALNRLDFSSAIQDLRRFNYVAKLFQLIARSQLTSLSGAAQKNYFNVLEKMVHKVLVDQYNPRLVKELLQDLNSTLYDLTVHMGRCVLVGNINIWLCRLETILKWQKQLNNLQIPEQIRTGLSFSDLPIYMHNKILCKLSDACDIVNLGQATPTLHVLCEDRILWKKLCSFHFSDKQFCRNMVLSNNDNVDWKLMYFTLQKHHPKKEEYGDTLHFCKHCSSLFWKDSGHPCTANNPDSCLSPVSPQHFIDLFKF
uniref:F-box only protein 25 n=1 Tax=Tetraodon nigroviridis TaxID=99883 RepID=H3D3W4_TETNG